MTVSSNFMARVRLDEQLWSAAMERAAADGTTTSALIREWLTDYVESGSKRPPVKITAAERAAVRSALDDIADRVVYAINRERA